MKRLAILFIAIIAVTSISLATPGDKLTNHSLIKAFFPHQLNTMNFTIDNSKDMLSTINEINTTKQKLDSAITYGE